MGRHRRVTGAGEQPAVGIVAGPVAPDVFGEQGDETVGDVTVRSEAYLGGRISMWPLSVHWTAVNTSPGLPDQQIRG
ncbi:MAG: hypothetical protein WBM01_26360 [Mycobacterium sp.]|uniref:hypothetical protein n=1 Tax=Mycobacterium sp. TaxID=1785 RepID=UPI003C7092B4